MELDPDTVLKIQERGKAKLDKNKEHAHRAMVYSKGLFMKVYNSLSSLANVTSNSIHVYLKLFSITDANQWRLVRSKMSKIFQPNIRLKDVGHLEPDQSLLIGISDRKQLR